MENTILIIPDLTVEMHNIKNRIEENPSVCRSCWVTGDRILFYEVESFFMQKKTIVVKDKL